MRETVQFTAEELLGSTFRAWIQMLELDMKCAAPK
jgi:hypothetical protein